MDDFHLLIIWLCIFIAIVVCGLMLYSVIACRRSKGTHIKTHFHQSAGTEMMWTVIPLLIFIAMMIPIVKIAFSKSDSNEKIIQSSPMELSIKNGNTGNKKRTLQELLDIGQKVYATQCAPCHQLSGLGFSPSFPALKGSKIATQPKFLNEHIRLVVQGKNAMPAFSTVLNDLEISAVVTYERNAWGNNTQDMVQPSIIKEFR
jgi:mono/diheme cytochrome c family protein